MPPVPKSDEDDVFDCRDERPTNRVNNFSNFNDLLSASRRLFSGRARSLL